MVVVAPKAEDHVMTGGADPPTKRRGAGGPAVPDDVALDAAVVAFLKALDLARFRSTFAEHEIDGASLNFLTAEDLCSMGIPSGPRRAIASALAARRETAAAAAAPSDHRRRPPASPKQATKARDLEPPDFLICPLSLDLFKEPVILLVDGQTYEKADIAAWINQHGTSPLTRQPAAPKDLIPNRAVLDAADAFRSGWKATS